MEFIHYTDHIKARAGKTKTFQVRNNRIQFRCTNCGAKRSIAIPPNLRRKNIQCHKCRKITKCILDKRKHRREAQSGKINLYMADGKQIEADLTDISPKGIGLKIPINVKKRHMLKPGNRVSFRCNWNRRLLSHGRYVIRNINERHIGFEKVM